MKALFVCTGNSCRSVIAQFLFNKLAADRGLAGWEARSCGVAAERHFPTPAEVLSVLAERGIEEVEHVPQLVHRDLLQWADVVLAMTVGHADYLKDQYPEFSAKIRLFLEFAGVGERDIDDPIGKPEPAYRHCRDVLEKALENILERHATKNP